MHKLLVESDTYKVIHEYEGVYLQFKNTGKMVLIGDFYGEPETAFISKDESYCVVGGCGIIIYFLEKPFHEYKYNYTCKQWKEVFRNPNDVWWVVDIMDGSNYETVKFNIESSDETRAGTYEIDVYTLNVKKLEE